MYTDVVGVVNRVVMRMPPKQIERDSLGLLYRNTVPSTIELCALNTRCGSTVILDGHTGRNKNTIIILAGEASARIFE